MPATAGGVDIHLLSSSLVLFLIIHVLMVFLAGFGSHMRSMITGRLAQENQ